MAYYYHDPSGLGVWYVQDGQTPAQAFDNLDIIPSPVLFMSVASTPAAHVENGGNHSINNTTSPPKPDGYVNDGASVKPKKVSLTQWQIDNTVPSKPRQYAKDIITGITDDCGCPDGYWADQDCNCIPLSPGPVGSPGGIGGVQQVTRGSVYVTVNTAVTLAKGVGDSIADVIKTGIADAADNAVTVAQNSGQAVTGAINNLVGGIQQGANDLLGSLHDTLGYIAGLVLNNVKGLIDFITNNIGKIMKDVGDIVTNVIAPAIQKIGDAIQQISDVISNTIAPIFNTIAQTYSQVVGLIDAIKRDVSNGLQGILQLPADLANSLSGVEGTLDRIKDLLAFRHKDGSSVTFGDALKESVGGSLSDLASVLTSGKALQPTSTTFTDLEKLTEPTINQAISKSFDALWSEIVTFVTNAHSSGAEAFNALKAVPLILPLLAEVEWSIPSALISFILATVAAYKPALEFIEDDIRAKTGLAKLDPQSALTAWVRGFISKEQMEEDLKVTGLDETRRKVMEDLQIYFIDVVTATDMYFRKIISEDDLRLNMTDHGIIKEDQDVIIAAAARTFPPDVALELYRRKILDEPAFREIMHRAHYTDAEQDAMVDLAFEPEHAEQIIRRNNREQIVTSDMWVDERYDQTPAAVIDAAAAHGLNADQAIDMWQESFNFPPLEQWLTLYFRRIRTRPQLDRAFAYFKIPESLRQDYIDAATTLIPFRTIPAMLKAGIIDEPYAKQQLQAHGFDLRATDALLKYATVQNKTVKAKTAITINTLSLATAKQFWQQHAITDDQYVAALEAHGYDKDTAELQLKIESLAEHAKERTQTAEGIINEALAGLITDQQAQQQFATNGFTLPETAKYIKQLRSTKRQNAKLPAEAELLKFFKASIITAQEYAQALAAIGYPQQWVDAFVALNKVQ